MSRSVNKTPREFDEQFIGIITSAKVVVGISFVSQHTLRRKKLLYFAKPTLDVVRPTSRMLSLTALQVKVHLRNADYLYYFIYYVFYFFNICFF